MLCSASGEGRRDIFLIEFDEGPDSPSQALQLQVDQNRERLNELIRGRGQVSVKQLRLVDVTGRIKITHFGSNQNHPPWWAVM